MRFPYSIPGRYHRGISGSGAAVKEAFEGETGKMIILKRVSDDPYICVTDIYDVHKVANVEKKVPREWINEAGDYVTDEFVNYIRPLIQAELTPIMTDGLPRHLYYTDVEEKIEKNGKNAGQRELENPAVPALVCSEWICFS